MDQIKISLKEVTAIRKRRSWFDNLHFDRVNMCRSEEEEEEEERSGTPRGLFPLLEEKEANPKGVLFLGFL
jgi:hypothetical protein